MLKRTLVLLIAALAQFGCNAEYGADLSYFKRYSLNEGQRQGVEREKRELLQIEDIKVGTGPVAAWGRRLSAELTIRYADGTLVYQGPIYTYEGFRDIVGIENDIRGGNLIGLNNPGIKLGLNGMAVGGKRRFTVDRKLVCQGVPMDAGPKAGCGLMERVHIRKEKLIVEATLTESCIPLAFRAIYMNGGYLLEFKAGCRDSDLPQLDPTAPIWHVY